MKKIFMPSFLYFDHCFQKNLAILVSDHVIEQIGDPVSLCAEHQDAQQIDWTGLAMSPGTINVHNHSFQSLLRGIATDRPFLEWRDQALYAISPQLDAQDLYTGALLAFGEMLRCGVTTVSDFFYVHNQGRESDEAVIRAATDIGIRLVLARTMYDWEGAPRGYQETVEQAIDNTCRLAIKYTGNDMVNILPAPHSLHAASLRMIKAGHQLAKELGTAYHIHVAEEPFEVDMVQKEYGCRPMELLDRIGVVNENMVAVHCVWLQPHEIDIMGEKGAKLAYCPSSNMFLADGVTDIPHMLKSGVMIGLGSDGGCSNNRVSIFEEMRMASLLQKVHTLDAMSLTYDQAFQMGTETGAAVLGLKTGRIEPGYKADFVGIDLGDLSMQPVAESGEQILPNLVYAIQPSAVRHVVVDGQERVQERRLVQTKEEVIVEAVQRVIRKIYARKSSDPHMKYDRK